MNTLATRAFQLSFQPVLFEYLRWAIQTTTYTSFAMTERLTKERGTI